MDARPNRRTPWKTMTLTALVALVLFYSPAAAQKKTPLVTYNAVAANPVTQQSARIVIMLYEWTSDEEDGALHQALVDGGSQALWNTLNKVPTKAWIRVTGEKEEPIQYARKYQNEDGTETIVLGSDRPVGFSELFDALRTRDFNISLGAIQLDPGTGKGTGVIAVGADIREGKDGQFIMEAFGTQPINLRTVTAKVPKQKKK